MSKAKRDNLLPINAIYFTWLRDYGKYNRPPSHRKVVNRRTGESRIIIKTDMDMIDYLIYINLLSRADKDDYSCFPSISMISSDCFNLDRRTVTDHLLDLEQMGYIDISRQKGKSNIYYMKNYAEWLKNPRHKDEPMTPGVPT